MDKGGAKTSLVRGAFLLFKEGVGRPLKIRRQSVKGRSYPWSFEAVDLIPLGGE